MIERTVYLITEGPLQDCFCTPVLTPESREPVSRQVLSLTRYVDTPDFSDPECRTIHVPIMTFTENAPYTEYLVEVINEPPVAPVWMPEKFLSAAHSLEDGRTPYRDDAEPD